MHNTSRVKPGTRITNLSVRNEWLSGNETRRKVGRGLEYPIGGMPIVYGDRLTLDPAPGFTGTKDKHTEFLAHLGNLAGGI